MEWNTTDELVGRRVIIYTARDEEKEATVLGVNPNGYTLRVRADDGDILIGNQWDDI